MRSAHRGAPGLRGGDNLYRHSIDQAVLTTMLVASVRNWFALGLSASMYQSVPNLNRGSIVSSFVTGGIESAVIQAMAPPGSQLGPRRWHHRATGCAGSGAAGCVSPRAPRRNERSAILRGTPELPRPHQRPSRRWRGSASILTKDRGRWHCRVSQIDGSRAPSMRACGRLNRSFARRRYVRPASFDQPGAVEVRGSNPWAPPRFAGLDPLARYSIFAC